MNSVALSKFSSNKEDAIKLVEFLLKPYNQEYFAERSHFFPAAAGAAYPKSVAAQNEGDPIVVKPPIQTYLHRLRVRPLLTQ